MEPFFDPKSKQPATTVMIPEGGTTVLGLKRPQHGDEIQAQCADPRIAWCDGVCKLALNKTAYNSASDTDEISTAEISKDTRYVQVVGLRAGETTVKGWYKSTWKDYASPVKIIVKENRKARILPSKVLFSELWNKHPLVTSPPENNPCKEGSSWLGGQCMIRFCTALHANGVDLRWLPAKRRCGQGAGHEHHYFDPYDFERYKGLKEAYVWEAKGPLQAEPMPGMAALSFMFCRWRGIVLFWNYWDNGKQVKAMAGGHIDLWDGGTIGNYVGSGRSLFGSFWRSRKIVFWPLESYFRDPPRG